MDAFTVWTRESCGNWRPVLDCENLDEAEAAYFDHALDHIEEYGAAPRHGRDMRLTRDIRPAPNACVRSGQERPGAVRRAGGRRPPEAP